MSAYYRLTDEVVLDLDPAFVAQLAPSKRATLRPYTVDPMPTPSATQRVESGPVVVTETEAHRTWLLLDKTAAELALAQFIADRAADLLQIRQVYTALKNGTGTNLERIVRCEKVLCRLLKDIFGGEPT